MTADPAWRVLLLGGAAGAGKSTAAATIARRLHCSWLSVDAIWSTLKSATAAETHPAFHRFEPPDEDVDGGAEHLFRLHIESAEAISESLGAFVDWQLREGERLVLEGAWITAQCAAALRERYAGAVDAVFICEADADAVLAAMMARASAPARTPRRLRLAEMSWRYGEWLRAESGRLAVPVVEARPRDTLVTRILDAAETRLPAAPPVRARAETNVRRATPGDLPRLRAMFERERELSGYGAETLERDDLVAWLVEDGGAIGGAILTHQMTTEDGESLGAVDELLVATGSRGRGIGRALMDAAEAHYRALGAAGMQLTVREGNVEAQRLYASIGYVVVHRRLRMRKTF
jgi:ribosomal protein S18 acetylase RimI-like enzyme/dephospho-CoA kinase